MMENILQPLHPGRLAPMYGDSGNDRNRLKSFFKDIFIILLPLIGVGFGLLVNAGRLTATTTDLPRENQPKRLLEIILKISAVKRLRFAINSSILLVVFLYLIFSISMSIYNVSRISRVAWSIALAFILFLITNILMAPVACAYEDAEDQVVKVPLCGGPIVSV
jgi:hypothetical protein